MSEMHRWLLFDRRRQVSYFVPEYDHKDLKDISCWGLYCFPSGTIFPSYCFNTPDPLHAVNALRSWAEGVCIPMRQPMSKDEVEKLVRLTAYYNWVSEGRPEGRAAIHWEKASKQFADLLKPDFLVVKVDQPEVSSGSDEVDSHGSDVQYDVDPPEPGGQESGQPDREEPRATFWQRFWKWLTQSNGGRLVSNPGTGRLVR